jgi:SagB-type dehydrogenase family enzyme
MGHEQFMSDDVDTILNYHLATKHRFNANARSPARLDWASRPAPFRRYNGAPLIRLERKGLEGPENLVPARTDVRSISKLLFHSLALAAWKRSATTSWSLRVNPSSGNLHPTEGYLLLPPMEGLSIEPAIFHYAPDEHGLEFLGSSDQDSWKALGLSEGALLIPLSSIYWREVWKYGERAFRYCMLDIGHSMGTVSLAASCLGWQTALLDDPGTKDLEGLLGFAVGSKEESEHPNCLFAVFTDGEMHRISLDRAVLNGLRASSSQSKPNILSPEHANWPIIEEMAGATIKPFTQNIYKGYSAKGEHIISDPCQILRRRRSAVALDGKTAIESQMFYRILRGSTPGRLPFNLLPWGPFVQLALFVHRVDELDRGIYMLIRDREEKKEIQEAISQEFLWEKPENCPSDIDLYLLIRGNAMPAAKQISCHQNIASDGCFCAAMLARFEEPLRKYGP